MLKGAIVGVLTLSMWCISGEAFAQRGKSTNMTRGECPPGTCALNGSTKANNIKNCRAQNCPGASGSSKRK
jgi:hypothetical protein